MNNKQIAQSRQLLRYLKEECTKCEGRINFLESKIVDKRGREDYYAELKAVLQKELAQYEKLTLQLERRKAEALRHINEHLSELTPIEAFYITKWAVEGKSLTQIQDECAINPEYSQFAYERSSIARYLRSAKAKIGTESGEKNE